MENKWKELVEYIGQYEKVMIAFSGGVDSTFLAYAAKKALGDNAIALTMETPYIPKWELQEAKELAADIGIQHMIIPSDIPTSIMNNPPDRCYLCKGVIFGRILEEAKALGIDVVMDGSNYDDTKDYRPGMRALKELQVVSPLLQCGWTKEMIREESKKAKLKTHDKPAYACLLTRLPHDTGIQKEELYRIEASEVYLMNLGFKAVRVRSHGDLARIEVEKERSLELFDEKLKDDISKKLKEFGYKYVTVDLGGYTMGSFNQKVGN